MEWKHIFTTGHLRLIGQSLYMMFKCTHVNIFMHAITSVLHLDVLHELLDISVPVWWDIAVGLHVEHRSQALPPQLVLLHEGNGRRCKQVVQRRQPLQRQRIVWLPAECGGVIKQPDPRTVGEQVVVHGRLLVEQRPGLATETRQRCFIRPEVCSVEDDGCRAFVQLDLFKIKLKIICRKKFTRSFIIIQLIPAKPSQNISGYLPIACSQAWRSGTVNALCVARKMWEQSPTPPQEDGQLLIGAAVTVARSCVWGDGGELHRWQGTLWLKGSTVRCVHGLQGKLVVRKGGKGDPDPAQDTEQPQTHTGHQLAPTCHLQGLGKTQHNGRMRQAATFSAV